MYILFAVYKSTTYFSSFTYIYIWSQNLNSSNKRANNNKGNKPRAAHRETGLRSQNIKYGINISTEIFVCKTKAIQLHFH